MRQCLIKILAITAIFCYLQLPSIARSVRSQVFTAKVIGVTDGDTIKVLHNKQMEKIRLSDIDCPEKKQPFGTQAKQYTSALVFGHTVTVESHGKDRYGRTIGEVWMLNGASVNRSLVINGLAWWYRQYSHDNTYSLLQAQAQWQHIGLWHDTHPVPPWVYRKIQANNRLSLHQDNKRAFMQ